MGNPTKRSSLLSWSGGSIWFVSLLLITGSFCLTLVQLSKGLHDQLLATRSKLHDCRKQLVQIGVEKETLLEHQREERTRVAKLRDKSALVSKELLEQNKRVRLLQFEFLAAREDLKLMTFNCTESSRLMEKQFGVTMRFLMDRVINNREYHILLNKHLKDRVKLERSLELMQNKVYNLTEKLSLAKTSLFVAGKSIAKAKNDVKILEERLITSNEALNATTELLLVERKKNEQPAESS